MKNLLNNKIDVAMCEICDNYTPRVYVEEFEQECCEYCFEAYGECNQHSRMSVATIRIRLDKQKGITNERI